MTETQRNLEWLRWKTSTYTHLSQPSDQNAHHKTRLHRNVVDLKEATVTKDQLETTITRRLDAAWATLCNSQPCIRPLGGPDLDLQLEAVLDEGWRSVREKRSMTPYKEGFLRRSPSPQKSHCPLPEILGRLADQKDTISQLRLEIKLEQRRLQDSR